MIEKIIIILCVLLLTFFIGALIMHDNKYVCIRGHYETQLVYQPSLEVMLPTDIWVCDEEMLRDDYNKLKNKDYNE